MSTSPTQNNGGNSRTSVEKEKTSFTGSITDARTNEGSVPDFLFLSEDGEDSMYHTYDFRQSVDETTDISTQDRFRKVAGLLANFGTSERLDELTTSKELMEEETDGIETTSSKKFSWPNASLKNNSEFPGEGAEEESNESLPSEDEETVPDCGKDGRVPFAFKKYSAQHKYFFEKFRKAVSVRDCDDREKVLIKVKMDELFTGFPKLPLNEYTEPNLSMTLIGLTRLRRGICYIPEERVLIRNDQKRLTQVKLLSGGMLGQEPLFTEYVGHGMLTAVVLGTLHGGPAMGAVIRSIKEIYTNRGVLILAQNSPENRLIFGVAMERARVEGCEKVDMILVGDDCWEKKNSPAGRRGLAGLVLAIKLAGALSESGENMKEVYQTVKSAVNTGMATISAITVPYYIIGVSSSRNQRQGKPLNGTLKELVKEMMTYILDPRKYFSLRLYQDHSYIVLINMYKMNFWKMYNVLNHVVEDMKSRGLTVCRVHADNFVGGPVHGFSITIMSDFKGSRSTLLDLPTDSCIWQKVWTSGEAAVGHFATKPEFSSFKNIGQKLTENQAVMMRTAVVNACKALIICEQILNTLHVFNRYGSEMRRGAEAILMADHREEINYKYPFNSLIKLSEILQNNLQGNTGAMYSCLLAGAAQPFLKNPVQSVIPHTWLQALDQALKTLRAYTDTREGIVSLAMTLIPIVQTLYGPMTKLNIEPVNNHLTYTIERAKKEIEERAKKGQENITEKQAVLTNQMDCETYAVIIWLDAIFSAISSDYESEKKGFQGDFEPLIQRSLSDLDENKTKITTRNEYSQFFI